MDQDYRVWYNKIKKDAGRYVHHLKLHRIRNLRNRIKTKKEVLSHYGKNGMLKCAWKRCTVSDIDILTLDHILNNGNQERKNGRGDGMRLYRALRKEGYPTGYQTLCANHQLKKEMIRRKENRT